MSVSTWSFVLFWFADFFEHVRPLLMDLKIEGLWMSWFLIPECAVDAL